MHLIAVNTFPKNENVNLVALEVKSKDQQIQSDSSFGNCECLCKISRQSIRHLLRFFRLSDLQSISDPGVLCLNLFQLQCDCTVVMVIHWLNLSTDGQTDKYPCSWSFISYQKWHILHSQLTSIVVCSLHQTRYISVNHIYHGLILDWNIGLILFTTLRS